LGAAGGSFLSVKGGGSYMDENLSDASDLTTDPTVDFFGKAVALRDRHVGVDRYMEIDPYHSTVVSQFEKNWPWNRAVNRAIVAFCQKDPKDRNAQPT
jgi:hypothetical protein